MSCELSSYTQKLLKPLCKWKRDIANLYNTTCNMHLRGIKNIAKFDWLSVLARMPSSYGIATCV